jgi:hypothetical protein
VLPPLPRNRREWAEKISATWRLTVESVLETGRLLVAAKASLPHGEFIAMIGPNKYRGDLPFGHRTAQMLMKVGADRRISNAKFVALLPPSWATLYELSKLDDQEFWARLASGDIRPELERKGRRATGARRAEGSAGRRRTHARRGEQPGRLRQRLGSAPGR